MINKLTPLEFYPGSTGLQHYLTHWQEDDINKDEIQRMRKESTCGATKAPLTKYHRLIDR